MSENIWWAADWRCPKCGASVPIEPAQDTRPISEAHECDPLAERRALRDGQAFALDLTEAEEHECVFVEEQEPTGRFVLPPCIGCGLTAMDALETLTAGVNDGLGTSTCLPNGADVAPDESKGDAGALPAIGRPAPAVNPAKSARGEVRAVNVVPADRAALMAWDFEHSKKRSKVYVDNRWQNECQCGATFPTMQQWEDHRIDEGVKMLTEKQERIAQAIEAIAPPAAKDVTPGTAGRQATRAALLLAARIARGAM